MSNEPAPEAVEAVAGAIDPDAFDPDVKRSTRGASLVQWMARRIRATKAATAALAFIRDALHRDGDDADAIREALGLTIERKKQHSCFDSPHAADCTWTIERRVVGNWQEVP